MERCKNQDPTGYDFFLETNDETNNDMPRQSSMRAGLMNVDDEIFKNCESQEGNSSNNDNEMDAQDEEHDQYVREDPIRKFQLCYDENVAMIPRYVTF